MEEIKIPQRYNYAEAYLTLRCNLNCSYCINKKSGRVNRNREELSTEQWADGLNRINFGDLPLTLGGGEPTMYKEFYKLLKILRPDIKIDLLTNLEYDVDEFIANTSPNRFNNCTNPAYKSIRVSFHAEKMDCNELIKKAKKLQDNGYNIGLFGLNHPSNIEMNMYITELARENKIFFFVKDFLGEYNGNLLGFYNYPHALDKKPKSVHCRIQELLIGPEGNIYRCHRDLYSAQGEIGNISDTELDITDKFRECHNYGNCNPCDVKLKTNRFLQMGKCSVEIIEKI